MDQDAIAQTGSSVQLSNEVSNGGKTDSGGITVVPSDQTTITKAVESSSPTEIKWFSTVHVPEQGLIQAVVTDTVPSIWRGHIYSGENGTFPYYFTLTDNIENVNYNQGRDDKKTIVRQ